MTASSPPAGTAPEPRGAAPAAAPHVSIVIPVYNEEGILRGSVLELQEKLRPFGFTYELLICENGSRDRTVEIGKEIEIEHPEVRMISVGQPNYGLAMKTGILEARGKIVICDEIDLCDTEFYARALALLERTDTDLVVGSKCMVGSNDQRPLVRRLGTRVYNQLLRTACRYKGTDTHGLKAFKREALVETARRCVLDRDVFASELVIRAHRERKKVVEIPFAVREKRPPSINLIKRVPHVLKSVTRLAMSVRDSGDPPGPG
jgi:glycosyltransferase involved in cell wall biosynthesis